MTWEREIIWLLALWGLVAPIITYRRGYTNGAIEAISKAFAIIREND